jgi:endoglucanase
MSVTRPATPARLLRAFLLLLTLLVASRAAAAEFIQNGTFDSGTAPWWTSNTTAAAVNGQMCVTAPAGTVNPWDAIVGQSGLVLEQGKTYTISFKARADVPVTIHPMVQLADSPYTATFSGATAVGTSLDAFNYTFTNTLPTGALGFQFQVGGGSASSFTVCFDDVSVSDGAAPADQELITNGTFDASTGPWWTTSGTAAAAMSGQMCVTVPPGTVNPWDSIVGQNGLAMEQGKPYAVSFVASSSAPVTIHSIIQLADAPYTAAFNEAVTVGTTPAPYQFSFTNTLPSGSLAFQFQVGGANAAGFTICFDNVSVKGAKQGYVPDTGPALRVNQVGYVVLGPKRADLVTDATTPQTWQLVDATGAVVATGQTTVYGLDAASGDKVHLIDFTKYFKPGTGYTLKVGDVVSYPFAISGSIYDGLRRDALEFFYHQRSGIPIDAQYVGAAWARPAGHLGVAPNQGDTLVPCLPGVCSYSADVRGGWYDAGDQGKYVVNGGIAVWQLMNTWERAYLLRFAQRDGTQKIPERANGVPDTLDEARWEMEFLLRMQIPDGQPYAGMAQHKVHDDEWTGFPTRPDQDAQPRHLRGPSTAATLNLAATAAQCGRVWRDIDPAFAKKCLVAAEKAYAAAIANPAVFCTPGGGGGDYGDGNLVDELYWAAAELFVTTGKKAYEDAVRSSPMYLAKGIPADGFGWADVSALGDLTLALVPNKLPVKEQLALRKAIIALADQRLATMQKQGYPVPYLPWNNQYVWGSNSQVLNQIAIIAVAFDLTFDLKYRQAAFEAMDYILGRNGLNMSYVTGYGTKFSNNEHHRFWANQANAAYPHPPAGAMAGGPNSYLQDPAAQAKLSGCAAHKCYIDSIESYSTNEVAINWNSALVWVSAWLSDHTP